MNFVARLTLASTGGSRAIGGGRRRSSAAGVHGVLGACALVLLGLFTVVPTANAFTQRPFKEPFGSAAQPKVQAETVEIELQNGNVLVGKTENEEGPASILRYGPDGAPAPFSGLGTNVIDGRADGGGPCPKNPASCDATPNGGLRIGASSSISVDESGTFTDGDIYLTEGNWVDIFAADGTYLGELTGFREQGFDLFNYAAGSAVGPTGTVYIGTSGEIYEFVPSANPPVDADGKAVLAPPVGTYQALNSMALGRGPTAGSLFILGGESGPPEGPGVFQFDLGTGAFERVFGVGEASGYLGLDVDPVTGAILFTAGERSIAEYEAVPGSEPKRLGRLRTQDDRVNSFALNAGRESIVNEYDFNAGAEFGVYGTPVAVPTVTVEPASGVTGTRAILSGAINPNDLPLTDCFFEYGEFESGGALPNSVPCEGALPPADSASHHVEAEIQGLKANGQSYFFRLVATVAGGQEESPLESFNTATTVVTEPAAPISTTSATLNGLLRPEGEEYSACYFEFGINTNPGFERRVPCTPRAEEVARGYSPQAVSAPLAGLSPATAYRFRLVAASPRQGVRRGEELTFTTGGAPRITDVAASGADGFSATLEAKVNPSGFGTSYHFEWGPTSAYGNRVPGEFEPFLGAGETPIRVTGLISGLAAGSIYHYRIVATSPQGVVASPDHVVETLNSCGLPEGRCFELVSRAEPGPIAIPGNVALSAELQFQVDPNGGAMTYPVEFGYPEARRGAEVLYRAVRGETDWQSTELSPPFVAQSEKNEAGSEVGGNEWLSDDLSCGFLYSYQPLTPDPAARQVVEAGGGNFYRLNPDHSYTVVTRLAPENVQDANGGIEYKFIGAAQDCSRVVFETRYRYPGISVPEPGAPAHFYEWHEGELRGLDGGFRDVDKINVVSADGSRIFYADGTMEENGVPREYAASQTGVAPEGVRYQWANRDGSRVFFTANAGLTATTSGHGSPEGTDLYEYDVDTGRLTDRTVVRARGGARVEGLVAATEDGSAVYFGSKVQLLAGRGPTTQENERAGTDSIYQSTAAGFRYVGAGEDVRARLYVGVSPPQVSADGRYLVFQSGSDITGYDSGGPLEVYLFDAAAGSGGTTTCVSCRQDGQPSVAPPGFQPLTVGSSLGNYFHFPRFLVVRGGSPEVFYTSPDALAPGAVSEQNNVYEWTHDQIFRFASTPAGTRLEPIPGRDAFFAGASGDGTDAYLVSPENLSAQDQDGRTSVFDARVGGGFPPVPAPPAACLPAAERSCEGASQSAAPPTAAATTGGGEDEAPAAKVGCAKTKCKKQKHRRHHAGHRRKKKSRRATDADRRAGR